MTFLSSVLSQLLSLQQRRTTTADSFRAFNPRGQQLPVSQKQAGQAIQQAVAQHQFCPYVGLIPELPGVKLEALWYLPVQPVAHVWNAAHPEFSVGGPPLLSDGFVASRPYSNFLDPSLARQALQAGYNQEATWGVAGMHVVPYRAIPVGICFSAAKLTRLNDDTPFVNRQLGLPMQVAPEDDWQVGYTSNSVTLLRQSLDHPVDIHTPQQASTAYPHPHKKLLDILEVGSYQQLVRHSGIAHRDPISARHVLEEGTKEQGPNRYQAMHTILPLARIDAELRVQEDAALFALVLIGQEAF